MTKPLLPGLIEIVARCAGNRENEVTEAGEEAAAQRLSRGSCGAVAGREPFGGHQAAAPAAGGDPSSIAKTERRRWRLLSTAAGTVKTA